MSGRYQKLLLNTLIFAIGSFASKAMVFLMMPLYTRVLDDVQFGTADIISTTANLLTPFVMLSINESIVRFGMDKSCKKREVFAVGFSTVLIGFGVFLIAAPLMLKIEMISPHTLLIYLYVLFAALKSITAQFVRSSGLVRLFAADGFLATATTIGFNLLFLVVFKWGSNGYILSIIASNAVSILFLFWVARLGRLLRPFHINKRLRREMLRYSIPLIPTTMFWWITTASDRYVITYFCGAAANGLYSAANKLPALLTLVSAIFYQAWQISAISESGQGSSTTRFYSEVLHYYQTLLLLAASGLIMLSKPLVTLMFAPEFAGSLQYVPFLTMAQVFSTLVTFLGTFYMVAKKNQTVIIAISFGAILNLCLNFYLVPQYGPLAAAFATFVSYLAAFLLRAVDVLRLVKLDFKILQLATGTLLLMLQGVLALDATLQSPLLIQIGLFCVMLLLNALPLWRIILSLYDKLILSPKQA